MQITKRVIWHDHNIFNAENTYYYNSYFKYINTERFNDHEQAINFIMKTREYWVLITSGRHGQELIKKIHNCDSIIGIIIFCFDVDYHRKWALNWPKVREIFDRFDDVINEIKSNYSKYITYIALKTVGEELNEIKGLDQAYRKLFLDRETKIDIELTNNKKLDFYHMQDYLEMEFRLIALLCIRHQHIPPQKILEELLLLNPEAAEKIQESFSKLSSDLLQAILYLYSTDYIYRPFNICFAKREYNRVMYTTAACLKEVNKALKNNIDISITDDTPLYRGIVRDKELVKKEYSSGHGYWPAFSSCSLDFNVAKEFSKGNIIFEIHLSKVDPHPNIKLENISYYPKESEVLLFPYFALKVKNIQDTEEYLLVSLEQDENQFVLTLNDEKFILYWTKVINDKISTCLDNILKKIALKITSMINLEYHLIDQFESTYDVIFKDCYYKLLKPVKKLTDVIKNLKYFPKMIDHYHNIILYNLHEKLKHLINSNISKAIEDLCYEVKEELIDLIKLEFIHENDLNFNSFINLIENIKITIEKKMINHDKISYYEEMANQIMSDSDTQKQKNIDIIINQELHVIKAIKKFGMRIHKDLMKEAVNENKLMLNEIAKDLETKLNNKFLEIKG